MKIQYRISLSPLAQQDAITELLREVARNRGYEDDLVVKLYYMAECGYSYDQIYHTYLMGR